ncbi:uncharacterized protein LOC127594875 [Hippocampus zosterae]|uniref:uncharacterized protein LOC127594875 n=1 Tax=Hippocampus zosterae TaxID=109293 RepID=UPI00223C9777|nr:uncharacterized protein LOC127594875 [Hippocampus zosterae]
MFLEYCEIATPTEFSFVYKPEADSFLLLSVLQEDVPSMEGVRWCLAADISVDACLMTQRYSAFHGVNNIDTVLSDAGSGISGFFDLVIINPPYVPTEVDEHAGFHARLPEKLRAWAEKKGDYGLGDGGNLVDLSYSGGVRGMEVTRRMLRHGLSCLSPEGSLYLFAIDENDEQEILALAEGHGRRVQTRASKKRPGERQKVLRLS